MTTQTQPPQPQTPENIGKYVREQIEVVLRLSEQRLKGEHPGLTEANRAIQSARYAILKNYHLVDNVRVYEKELDLANKLYDDVREGVRLSELQIWRAIREEEKGEEEEEERKEEEKEKSAENQKGLGRRLYEKIFGEVEK